MPSSSPRKRLMLASTTPERGVVNRALSTLRNPDSAGLSVKVTPVDSRYVQLERGTCHTLWHRLDLDLMSNESNIGRLSAYTCVNACRFILERWAEPAELLVETKLVSWSA